MHEAYGHSFKNGARKWCVLHHAHILHVVALTTQLTSALNMGDLYAAIKIQIRKRHMAAIIIPATFSTKNNSLDTEQLYLFSFYRWMGRKEERFHCAAALVRSRVTAHKLDIFGWYNHRVISFLCLCLSSKVPQKQYDQGNQEIILSDDF